jgi:hypothetical protein
MDRDPMRDMFVAMENQTDLILPGGLQKRSRIGEQQVRILMNNAGVFIASHANGVMMKDDAPDGARHIQA